jgi:hypothetical protein
LDAVQSSRNADCLNEFEDAAKCANSNFSCDAVTACDGVYEDYARCILD